MKMFEKLADNLLRQLCPKGFRFFRKDKPRKENETIKVPIYIIGPFARCLAHIIFDSQGTNLTSHVHMTRLRNTSRSLTDLITRYTEYPGLARWILDEAPSDPAILRPYMPQAFEKVLEGYKWRFMERFPSEVLPIRRRLSREPCELSPQERRAVDLIMYALQDKLKRRKLEPSLVYEAAKIYLMTLTTMYERLDIKDRSLWPRDIVGCLKELENAVISKEELSILKTRLTPSRDLSFPEMIVLIAMIIAGADRLSAFFI